MINILTEFAATTGATRIGHKLLSKMTVQELEYQKIKIAVSVEMAVKSVDVGLWRRAHAARL